VDPDAVSIVGVFYGGQAWEPSFADPSIGGERAEQGAAIRPIYAARAPSLPGQACNAMQGNPPWKYPDPPHCVLHLKRIADKSIMAS
jgi:hypothetical protein